MTHKHAGATRHTYLEVYERLAERHVDGDLLTQELESERARLLADSSAPNAAAWYLMEKAYEMPEITSRAVRHLLGALLVLAALAAAVWLVPWLAL